MANDFHLRPHQIEALASYMVNAHFIDRSEPGTGKTPTTCVYQRYLFDSQGICTVFVMPKSLLEKNRDECLEWGEWDDGQVVIVDGTPAQVARQIASPRAAIMLMGFQRFGKVWRELPARFTAIVADEFHKGFGGDESQVTQSLYSFMHERGSHFLALTGTLINGKPDTAYPAIRIIEPRYYGSLRAFQNTHHCVDPFTQKVTGYKDLDLLREILEKHSVNLSFAEVYGHRREPVIDVEWLMMHPNQRRMYDDLEQHALLELEKFFVDGTQPGTKFIRCRQVMDIPNHFPDLTEDPASPTVDILDGEPTAKAEALARHLLDHAERKTPVVVFAALRPQQCEALEIARACGLRTGFIGDVSAKTRTADSEAFRRGDLDCLVCSPLIADTGFNWQHSGAREVCHAIYASLDYRDTALSQSYGRMFRGRRTSPLLVTILAYRKSIDRRIMTIVEKKSQLAAQVDPSRDVISFGVAA